MKKKGKKSKSNVSISDSESDIEINLESSDENSSNQENVSEDGKTILRKALNISEKLCKSDYERQRIENLKDKSKKLQKLMEANQTETIVTTLRRWKKLLKLHCWKGMELIKEKELVLLKKKIQRC